MTRKIGLEATRKVLATLSLLGVSLGVSAAAPSSQQTTSDGTASGAHGTLKLAEVKSNLQSNQFKYRSAVGNSSRVGMPPGPPTRIRVQNLSTSVKTLNVRTPQINPRIIPPNPVH